MDLFKIKGPHNYFKYFHTNSEGLVWIDGRGNPIPLDMDVSTHVECKSPVDLWNNKKARHRLHTKDLPSQGMGPSNSTAATQNIPPSLRPPAPFCQETPLGMMM